MPIRGIVFDKDGTLLDFHATWLPAIRAIAYLIANGDPEVISKMMIEGGHDPQTGKFASGSLMAAYSNHEIAVAWQKYAPDRDVETLVALINGIGKSAAAFSATPVPDLQKTIKLLATRGFALGLATSDSYESAHETLSPFGILEHFDFVCGYDSGHGVKPGPGMVLGFCEKTGCLPSEVAVVGDNAHDMDMAMNANAALRVGVLTGTSSEKELEALANHVIPSISDLVTVIDAFNAGETQ